MDILEPLKTKYSKEGIPVRFGSAYAWYESSASEVEAFLRPLWGLAPYWAGGGKDDEFLQLYINGIINGTDPTNENYWGECHDYDQKFVEMAALAYALLLVPDMLWKPMTESQKNNCSEWMSVINKRKLPQSNWLFFRVLVNIALKKLNRDYDSEILNKDLNIIDTLYIGNGWYSDGKYNNDWNGQKDYYIAFAIHFYSIIYAKVMEQEDTTRSDKYKKRAYEFAQDYIYWFSDSGAAVPYGRSMTYRFAQIAFWSACIFAGIYPFPIGVIKGIIERNLNYWSENDMIFDNGHILTIGYKYNQPQMSENYNSYGSPYWCMKAFAFLALPDDDGFWSAKPEPLPMLDKVKTIKNADMIVSRCKYRANIFPAGTLSHFGCGNTDSKYLKFAYSSFFGFSVPKSNLSINECAPDSTLAFEYDGRIFTRIRNNEFEISNGKLTIKWSPMSGINVLTVIIPTESGHIRKHIVEADFACIAYDSGFAVACGDLDECIAVEKRNLAEVKNKFSRCRVESYSGKGCLINASPNTNLMWSKTVIPTIKYDIKQGNNTFTTYIYED